MGTAADAPLADLLAAARAWAADDPDAVTRAELDGLASAAESGDEAAAAELADAMAGMLEFGTAGLRGRLGGGPNRMNRAVVIRAAAGLTAYLKTVDPEPFVVVGYDARTNSDVFAHDTCAVVIGMGGQRVGPAAPATDARCSPTRSATSARMPASWSPRRTTRPRTTGTRSTSATARRSCRRWTG